MKHGCTAGHNLRLDFRFGLGDPDRLRKYATELVANCVELTMSAPESGPPPIATDWRAGITATVPVLSAAESAVGVHQH